MRDAAERRKAYRSGIRAEWIALCWLRLKTYRILACRYIVKGGEIDIVARRGDTIAFIEVKARAHLDEARIAIDAVKERRLSRAARVWLGANPWASSLTLRGDALYIAPWCWPRHSIAAIELDLG
ncbi:MAG TPA: YraN family protein [Beijerinckia sp.]|jgi:putative endonuclease|nr:YraN family protein [Beijerinckia sp.]